MPTRPGLQGEPRDFVKRGGTWPDGPFIAGTPVTILYGAEIVSRLRAAIAGPRGPTPGLL